MDPSAILDAEIHVQVQHSNVHCLPGTPWLYHPLAYSLRDFCLASSLTVQLLVFSCYASQDLADTLSDLVNGCIHFVKHMLSLVAVRHDGASYAGLHTNRNAHWRMSVAFLAIVCMILKTRK